MDLFVTVPFRNTRPTFQEMKSQEGRETKGFYFVVSDDLRSCPTLKAESHRRTVFTILRHCQRIKEIRRAGAGVRYAVRMMAHLGAA